MVNETRKELDLLRQRDKAKKSMQVWVALTVIWFVIGWAPWGVVGGYVGHTAGWAVYLIPLVVLAAVAAVKFLRVRAINAEIVEAGR